MDNQKRGRSEEPKLHNELTLKANSLFKLDINYDYLKTYLGTFSLNQEQDREDINKLLSLTGLKSLNNTLQDDYHAFAESLSLSDNLLINEMQESTISYTQMISGKFKVQGPYEKALIDARVKMFTNTNLLQMLCKQNKQQETRITSLETQIEQKYDTKECKQKMKKIKQTGEKLQEEVQMGLRLELGEVEKHLNLDILKFEESIRDVERKTLWKIHDCQDLLSKRINEEFVSDSIIASEDKIMKAVALISGGEQTLKFQQELLFMRTLISGQNDHQSDKQQKMKIQIAILTDQLKAKSNLMDQLQESNKTCVDRISDVNLRLQNALNRLDFSFKVDQHSNQIKFIEDQLQKMNDEQTRKMESLKDLNLNSENITLLLSKIDPHKICSLDGDIKKLEEQSIRNTVRWETLDAEFKNKFDTVNFFQCLQQAAAPVQQKEKTITRDEVLKLMADKGNNIDEDKFKKLQKEVADMSYKIENSTEVEKRVTRIFKDLDINGIIKSLKNKANEEEVKKELYMIETRLTQTMETVGNLRRELDLQKLNLKKSNSFYGTNSAISPPTDISLNTKKLYPVGCLSCQVVTKDVPVTAQRLRGNDGKYYKADLNKTMCHFETEDQPSFKSPNYNTTVGNLMSRYNRPQRPISAKK